jgi:hypothetical protein
MGEVLEIVVRLRLQCLGSLWMSFLVFPRLGPGPP